MTSLIAATVVCWFLSPTFGQVTITAQYQHEWPPGQTYRFVGTELVGLGHNQITAEGHPSVVRVAMGSTEIERCVYVEEIFEDGLESGDLSMWDGGS